MHNKVETPYICSQSEIDYIDFEFSTSCIICGEEIRLNNDNECKNKGVVCENCRNAIMYVRNSIERGKRCNHCKI